MGGISATCAEAFRPYSPVLANLTGVCYWWAWIPTCGLTALLAASALTTLYVPWIPVPILASGIVLLFTVINLCGVRWAMRAAMPLASVSALLAFLSAVIPIVSGTVDWQRAFSFQLTVPFEGWFGQVTSIMAGLYLIGFAAPAFEQATSHVGETINPNKNVPRAIFVSAGLAALYFVVLPVIWLGALGPEALGQELALVLGPTFAPLFGGAAVAAATWFMVFNMLHGTLAPLAGAARVLAQLAEDGLLPEFMAQRSRTDAPWVTTIITAVMAIFFLWMGDPLWLIAAANLTYLIGIALPSVAVWLLRRNEPGLERPFRAPQWTIHLGLGAAGVWGLTVLLGFQQFGLTTVIIGICFAYSGSVLYAWRKFADRRKEGLPGIGRTLHIKLTGAMLLVLVLDAVGYLIAVNNVSNRNPALVAMLEDIFVVVALLTIAVGLILPGMIAHSAVEVSRAADRLVHGTMADFSRAMQALAAGDLEAAKVRSDVVPLVVHSQDEVGDMALKFNELQAEIGRAAAGVDGAREGLSRARDALNESNEQLRRELAEKERTQAELQRHIDQAIAFERGMFALRDVWDSDLPTYFASATSVIADALAVERVSVWLFDGERQAIVCNELFCRSTRTRDAGIVLPVTTYPKYFQALAEEIPLVAHEARTDPATREFTDGYLVPLGITSVLDQPLFVGGVLVGVLCCEHVGEPRVWTTTESEFVGGVCSHIMLAMEQAQRKEADAALRAAHADLEASNRELLAFSYSISHDLRTPLRGIDGWSHVLLEDYGDRLDDRGRGYIERVRTETQRLGTLIDAMLGLSRMLQAELQPITVDLSVLAAASIASLQETQPDRAVQVRIEPGLEVRGDATLLQSVVANLMENAWRYTGNQAAASIEFGLLEQAEGPVFFVRDNGAGFNMAYADKLFKPFQRMHKQSEFPGIGIGLTNVQRIIQRHGGKIWAEAEVDRGATFYFTLPTPQHNPAPRPAVEAA